MTPEAQELFDLIYGAGGGSDIVRLVVEDIPDTAANLAESFDLNTVKDSWVREVRDEVIRRSQEELRRKGIPAVFEVWRGGDPVTHVVPVTLSLQVAAFHACRYQRGGVVKSWKIRHEDVLVYVDLFQRSFVEDELLVKRSALTGGKSFIVDCARFR